MRDKILTILMWAGVVLVIPLLMTFWLFLVIVFLLIAISGLIYFIYSYVVGEPIPITKNGKEIGVLIRGTYHPHKR